MTFRLAVLLITTVIVKGSVLDPSLYLAPSPPLKSTNNDISPEELWSQAVELRIERDIANKDEENIPLAITTEKENMEKSETFWPNYGTYGLKSLHIPLTFRISGTYGGLGGSGIVASSYTGMEEDFDNTGHYGTPSLAGTGYMYGSGKTRTTVFGNKGSAAWSGWGNGRWGHYGKG